MSMPPFSTSPAQPSPSPFELKQQIAWPVLLFQRIWRDHPKHAEGLISCFTEMRAKQAANIDSKIAVGAKSEHGLYESTLDLFETSQNEHVKQLARFCASSIRRAAWAANGGAGDPKFLRVEFVDSWYHITNDNGFHDAHYHSGCSWCGIYYVQAGVELTEKPSGAGNGVSRFYAPVGCGGMTNDYGNSYLGTGMIDVPPRDGMLVIFPAFLLHSGLPYKGEKDRVIVAFNTCVWTSETEVEI